MKIAVIGSLTQDEIIIPERKERFFQPGGGVYYASTTLAFLGAEVLALPILSKKDSSLLEALKKTSITVLPQWSEKTTKYINTYRGVNLDVCDKRIISSAEGYELDGSAMKEISKAMAVHLVPLFSREFKPSLYAKLRKAFKNIVSLDGQGLTQGPSIDFRRHLSGFIDIMKLDDSELFKITSQEKEKMGIFELNGWNIFEVLVTKANKGSTVYHRGKIHQVAAVKPAKIVDATGCGDAYIAAYLFKRLKGYGPLVSANFASGIASEKLGRKGALTKD